MKSTFEKVLFLILALSALVAINIVDLKKLQRAVHFFTTI